MLRPLDVARLCCALAGALLVLPAGAATPAGTPAAEEIRQLEADINAAYAANDLARYFSFYAEDFRGMFPEGPTTLAQYKSSWSEFIRKGGAILRFTYTELQIQVAPGADAAVASYNAAVRTKNLDGSTADDKYQETDVFFKRDGRWKLVEVQYSLVK
jgi:ketosteroid isomerase-like protein